jgi:hypothetical protein
MARKFILTESEKNEIKSLYKSKGLLTEASDPKNADSYPDGKNWRLQDWQTFYIALKKKWGDRNKARAQFLRYWEPLEQSWWDEPAEDEMDNDNSWFRIEGMWNEKEKRPFTQKEFEEVSKESSRCLFGDCENGKGKVEWLGGHTYLGDFKDGLFNGKGKFVYKQGDYYEGDYKDGSEDGKGKYVWNDGKYYEGDFKDGEFNGKGIYVNLNKVKFTGDWENDESIGTTWPELNNLKTQEEADQLMSKIAGGSNEVDAPGSSSSTTNTQTNTTSSIDTTDCWSLFDEAKKEVTYNPCNLKDGKVVIGKGNQGALVKAMQCFLNRTNEELSLGLPSLKVDGKFGDKTKEMVIKFQQKYPNELKDDGIIGKNTYLAGLIPGETGNC